MMMSTDYDKDNCKNRHRCVDCFLYATSSYMHLLHMFMWHSVLTVTFIHHRVVEMLSIGPVIIKNGMLRSISSWRELILTWRIRWVLFNDNFTDPYHLYLYCIMLVIDDAWVYLVVHYIVIVIIIIHVNHLTRMDIYLTHECTRNLSSFLFTVKSELGWWYCTQTH